MHISPPTLKKKGKFYITRKFYIKDQQQQKKKKAFENTQNDPNIAGLSGYNKLRIER